MANFVSHEYETSAASAIRGQSPRSPSKNSRICVSSLFAIPHSTNMLQNSCDCFFLSKLWNNSFNCLKIVAQTCTSLIVFSHRSKTQRQGARPSSRPPAPRKWFGERHKIAGTEAMPTWEQVGAGTPIPDEALRAKSRNRNGFARGRKPQSIRGVRCGFLTKE